MPLLNTVNVAWCATQPALRFHKDFVLYKSTNKMITYTNDNIQMTFVLRYDMMSL